MQTFPQTFADEVTIENSCRDCQYVFGSFTIPWKQTATLFVGIYSWSLLKVLPVWSGNNETFRYQQVYRRGKSSV